MVVCDIYMVKPDVTSAPDPCLRGRKGRRGNGDDRADGLNTNRRLDNAMVDCHIYGEAGYYPPLTPVARSGVKNLTLVFKTGKVLTEVMST